MMSSQDSKSVVQQIFAAAGAADWDTVRSHMHDDICVFEPDSVPYSGVKKGVDAMIELMKEVYGFWEDHTLDIKEFVAEGDTVVMLAIFHGRGRTGLSFAMPMAAEWKIRDGKAYEVRPYYFDTKVLHDAHYGPSA